MNKSYLWDVKITKLAKIPKIVIKGKFNHIYFREWPFRPFDKYKENLRWGGGVL